MLERIIWRDILYLAEIQLDHHFLRFRIFNICLGSDDINDTDVWFREKDSAIWEPTKDIENALCMMSGDIRMDGCMNLIFPEQEECMLHFCGRKDAANIGIIINRIYDVAAERLKDWRE